MLLERSQSYQDNDPLFNIHLMCLYKLQVVICGKNIEDLFVQIYISYYINLNYFDNPIFHYSCEFFRGTFRMERDDGFMFDCRIPPFSLESKQDDPTTNGGDPNGPVIIGN